MIDMETAPPADVPPAPVPLTRRVWFWRHEIPVRLRGWWRRRWWPARIRQLDRERAAWKRWHDERCEIITRLVDALVPYLPGEPDRGEFPIEYVTRILDERTRS